MKTPFTDCYDFLVKQLAEIDRLLLFSAHGQFERQFFILRLRQKKEWDDLQDKLVLKGGAESKSFRWEQAPVMNRAKA